MRFGVHLPQYGRAASYEAIQQIARHAENRGFDDVWVSDHIAVPDGAPYPPPALLGPFGSLAVAMAATTTIGVGTSALVMPYRHPLEVAKEIGSIAAMAPGRVTLAVAGGFLEGEFAALGVPIQSRAQRLEEGIAALRAAWATDPSSFSGDVYRFAGMRSLPAPAEPVDIWVAGMSRRARRRAALIGDGWHGISLDPTDAADTVASLRNEAGDKPFTVSVRMPWDGLRTDGAEISSTLAAFEAAGVDHVLVAPAQPEVAGWQRSIDALDAMIEPFRTK